MNNRSRLPCAIAAGRPNQSHTDPRRVSRTSIPGTDDTSHEGSTAGTATATINTSQSVSNPSSDGNILPVTAPEQPSSLRPADAPKAERARQTSLTSRPAHDRSDVVRHHSTSAFVYSGQNVAGTTSRPRGRRVVNRSVMTDAPGEHTSRRGVSTTTADRLDDLGRMSAARNTHVRSTAAPHDAPPPYEVSNHSPPDMSNFNFSDAVVQFLRSIEAGPGLCAEIDNALKYHHADWETCFRLAGLGEEVARRLQALALGELSPEIQMILTAASDTAPQVQNPSLVASSHESNAVGLDALD